MLGENATYQVVPQKKVKARLRAQKKRTYKRCYAKDCQLALGRQLGAGLAIATRIARKGPSCRVTLAVSPLGPGAVASTAEAYGACADNELLAALKTAVGQLRSAGAAATTPRPAARLAGPAGPAPALVTGMPAQADPADPNAAPRCPRGLEVVAGYCCWPGQNWGTTSRRCIGTARCPAGFVAAASGCRRGCKTPGKVPVGEHCCWPGQDWGARTQKCIGAPAPPRP